MTSLVSSLFAIILAALIGCQSVQTTPQDLSSSSNSNSTSPPAAAQSLKQSNPQPQISSGQTQAAQSSMPPSNGMIAAGESGMTSTMGSDQAPNGMSNMTSMIGDDNNSKDSSSAMNEAHDKPDDMTAHSQDATPSTTQLSSESTDMDMMGMATNSNIGTDMASESVTAMTDPSAPMASQGTNVNDAAFGFTLPSARGPEYSLESFKGEKNVVLVFYRAFW